jgi:hypothetical protein
LSKHNTTGRNVLLNFLYLMKFIQNDNARVQGPWGDVGVNTTEMGGCRCECEVSGLRM